MQIYHPTYPPSYSPTHIPVLQTYIQLSMLFMEIFKYEPEWLRIEKRKGFKIEGSSGGSQKIKIPNAEFKLKEAGSAKKKAELCTICKKDKHALSACPQREVKKVQELPAQNLYKLDLVFTPTTVRLQNLPSDLQRQTLREILKKHDVKHDGVHMVYDKINREEFKGVVYIDLPTEKEGEKCIRAFDGLKMDVLIVNAETVEVRQKL